ncbi:glycosyltransferase family 2 protein [Desulfosarcina variabilis]|uniref:glycosyltransferase family 2 protein n=1 Tax=Desulfosarcina variabilis TaxID=2300 RepID=UPI003AFA8C66
MSKRIVSIGLPVYNGENYIEKTLKCLTQQSYKNIEILISDNASTDKTAEICDYFASMDKRVKFFRNKINRGATWNYNYVFYKSKGEYFKWAAHDDLISKFFIEKCIQILDNNPDILLCHSKILEIDENDNFIKTYPSRNYHHNNTVRRVFEYFKRPHAQCAVFGVFRSSALSKTRLIESFYQADRVLIAEILLRGFVFQIPEYLFFKRSHPNQHWKIHNTKSKTIEWYDPNIKLRKVFTHWRLLKEYCISINRSPLANKDNYLCNLLIIYWIRKNYSSLFKNIFY